MDSFTIAGCNAQYIDAFGFIFYVWWFDPFILVGLVVYAQRKIDLGDFPVLLPPLFFWVAFNMLTFLKV
jgi:hypothetical protein